MKTVFVKKGSSKSYTNLITSSAPLPLGKKKRKSQEPIGQQQQPLGINNAETQTTHKEGKCTAGVCSGLVYYSQPVLPFYPNGTELNRNAGLNCLF